MICKLQCAAAAVKSVFNVEEEDGLAVLGYREELPFHML